MKDTMKYTVDKGIYGIQEISVLNENENRISKYIRETESKLRNELTLIEYRVCVEYENVEGTEVIVNLKVQTLFKDEVLTSRVIDDVNIHILNLVRLPLDVLPFVTATILANECVCSDVLFKNLFLNYNKATNQGIDSEVEDYAGLGVIRKVLSDDFCSVCSLGNVLQ